MAPKSNLAWLGILVLGSLAGLAFLAPVTFEIARDTYRQILSPEIRIHIPAYYRGLLWVRLEADPSLRTPSFRSVQIDVNPTLGTATKKLSVAQMEKFNASKITYPDIEEAGSVQELGRNYKGTSGSIIELSIFRGALPPNIHELEPLIERDVVETALKKGTPLNQEFDTFLKKHPPNTAHPRRSN